MRPRQSINFSALRERGWIEISDIYLPDELVDVATQLGHVVHQESRPLVSALKPTPVESARFSSASKQYGTGEFPPHTDLAHWPTPPKFIVMGNFDTASRTPTLLLDTRTDKAFRELRPLAKRAIWKVLKARRAFNCSMVFTQGDIEGLRWDESVMSPSNSAAESLAQTLRSNLCLSKRDDLHPIHWHQAGRAIIVDNWRVLHARPAVPTTDLMRTLHRVFVTGE